MHGTILISQNFDRKYKRKIKNLNCKKNEFSINLTLAFYFKTTTDVENKCTGTFAGTSASAPMAAAVIALGLDAKFVKIF